MRIFLATGFGLGRFPFAGSLASLAACLPAMMVADPGGLPERPVFLVLAAVASFVCLTCGSAAEEAFGVKDPQTVVVDEFAGMWLAMAICPPGDSLPMIAAVFGAFRLFDGLKPLGISKLQKFHGGAGILLDDLVAGAAAGALALGVQFIPGISK